MMAVDLRHCGYRRRDVLGIYGFNLILLPVNLAGAGASMLQLVIGGRPAFKRTPKVRSRTTPGFTFVVMPYVFVAFSVAVLISDVSRDRWVNAALAVVNATLAGYAIVAYIGVLQLDRRRLEQRRQLALQAAAPAARQARRTPSGGADHHRRRPSRALVADARLRLGGRRATGGAPSLLPSRRLPGRPPLAARRPPRRRAAPGRARPPGHDRRADAGT